MGVHTTAGFAIRSPSSARVATVDPNIHPVGIAPHARSQKQSGKTVTVTWLRMSVQHLRPARPRSIRSKLPKEPADKTARDQSVNPARPTSGATSQLTNEYWWKSLRSVVFMYQSCMFFHSIAKFQVSSLRSQLERWNAGKLVV
jgi:hypothetical protein